MCHFCAGQRDFQGNLTFFTNQTSESSFKPFSDSKKLKRLPSVSFTLVKTELKDGPLTALFRPKKQEKIAGFLSFQIRYWK